MREFATAILEACDFVDGANPEWAAHRWVDDRIITGEERLKAAEALVNDHDDANQAREIHRQAGVVARP